MATKQVIEIDVTWSGWKKLKLNALLAWLSNVSPELEINRITVREVKKK
jgi:hypothetical protein